MLPNERGIDKNCQEIGSKHQNRENIAEGTYCGGLFLNFSNATFTESSDCRVITWLKEVDKRAVRQKSKESV